MILITGALGYIGKYVVKELEKTYDKTDLILLDDLSNSTLTKEIMGNYTLGDNLQIISLLEIEKLERVFRKNNIELVIHLAGYKSVSESMVNSTLYYLNNVVGTINLLHMCDKYECKNIIFSSSAAVYESKDTKLREDDKLNPISPYATTKHICEQLLENLYNTNNKYNISILRYFNVVGGVDNCKKQSTNLLPTIERCVKNNEELSVFGCCRRDYVSVYDIAHANILAKDKLNGFNIYNLGSGQSFTTYDVIKAYEENNNVTLKIRKVESRLGDADSLVANIDKAKKELGYNPNTNLNEILK